MIVASLLPELPDDAPPTRLVFLFGLSPLHADKLAVRPAAIAMAPVNFMNPRRSNPLPGPMRVVIVEASVYRDTRHWMSDYR